MVTITSQFPTLAELFAQLGLDNSEEAIEQFFKDHAPLSETIDLWDAPWWNKSQSQLLHEILSSDSEWAMIVDELNTRLREKP